MGTTGWAVMPGDWVELRSGRRGMVLTTCSTVGGTVFGVEVGFDWFSIEDIVVWKPREE